nr:DUF4295 domain-containing protein [Bacteroidota bacterium]
MAKKVVASLQTQAKDYAKVIQVVRSKKTGAYTFTENVVPNEKVQEFISKK